MNPRFWAAPLPESSSLPSGRGGLVHPRDPSHEQACDEEPRRKRPKRGNYVCKACIQCQRRKTKVSMRQPTEDVVGALSKIQRQLNQIIGHDQRIANPQEEIFISPSRPGGSGCPISSSRVTSRGESILRSDADAFDGEPSIANVLHEMEDHLKRLGMGHALMVTPPPSQPLTPVHDWPEDDWEKNKLQRVLDSHGVPLDKEHWDKLLHTFLDEIYTLYPFLHPPALWSTYENLVMLSTTSYETVSDRLKFAQVLFCLATGRCSESTRTDTGDGRHSAGWSLFRAGMDFLGQPLEILDDYSVSLEALQAIILAVIYLFRVDANRKAEKLLALVVSHSHSMGLHRKQVTNEMPIFEAEMFRRLWWCTYIIDRRLALDTGRPFLIQDVNTDVPAPLELSETWLSQHIHTNRTSKQLTKEIKVELDQEPITPLPHLIAMINFSRVMGKIWEAHFGAMDTNASSTPLTTEYLEFLVSSTVQKELSRLWSESREPYHLQFAGMKWWQVKQKILMRVRWLFLRLLIRKSSLRISHLSEVDKDANEMICIQLARAIILEFNHIPDKYPKHTFPFINYVATATIIALGLIIKQPSFNSMDVTFIRVAARTLKRFCTQTWVSGRIIRAVARIDQVSKLVMDKKTEENNDSMDLVDENGDVSSDAALENFRPLYEHQAACSKTAFQQTFNEDSGKDLQIQTNASNYSLNQFGTSTHQTLLQDGSRSTASQQAPSNVTWGMEAPILPELALDNLMMTDFDFEEYPTSHNESNGDWPWLPGFLDPSLSIPYHESGANLGRESPDEMLFSNIESIPFETIYPETN